MRLTVASVTAGQQVDVGAVARVEPERVHRVGEELRVDALGDAAAVLVGLDLHERRLRRAVQARQRPRVRVGLLELVRRAVDDELEHLLERRVALDVARQRRRVVGVGDRAQREVHVLGPRRRRRHAAPRRAARPRSRPRGRDAGEQARLPLPRVGDAGQAAVVQLVAEVQRELEVLVAERVRRRRHERREQRVDRLHERREQMLARSRRGAREASSTRGAHTPRRPRLMPGRRPVAAVRLSANRPITRGAGGRPAERAPTLRRRPFEPVG